MARQIWEHSPGKPQSSNRRVVETNQEPTPKLTMKMIYLITEQLKQENKILTDRVRELERFMEEAKVLLNENRSAGRSSNRAVETSEESAAYVLSTEEQQRIMELIAELHSAKAAAEEYMEQHQQAAMVEMKAAHEEAAPAVTVEALVESPLNHGVDELYRPSAEVSSEDPIRSELDAILGHNQRNESIEIWEETTSIGSDSAAEHSVDAEERDNPAVAMDNAVTEQVDHVETMFVTPVESAEVIVDAPIQVVTDAVQERTLTVSEWVPRSMRHPKKNNKTKTSWFSLLSSIIPFRT